MWHWFKRRPATGFAARLKAEQSAAAIEEADDFLRGIRQDWRERFRLYPLEDEILAKQIERFAAFYFAKVLPQTFYMKQLSPAEIWKFIIVGIDQTDTVRKFELEPAVTMLSVSYGSFSMVPQWPLAGRREAVKM